MVLDAMRVLYDPLGEWHAKHLLAREGQSRGDADGGGFFDGVSESKRVGSVPGSRGHASGTSTPSEEVLSSTSSAASADETEGAAVPTGEGAVIRRRRRPASPSMRDAPIGAAGPADAADAAEPAESALRRHPAPVSAAGACPPRSSPIPLPIPPIADAALSTPPPSLTPPPSPGSGASGATAAASGAAAASDGDAPPAGAVWGATHMRSTAEIFAGFLDTGLFRGYPVRDGPTASWRHRWT